MQFSLFSCVHRMRRTTPPVAGAERGADCSTGPKRAGSGGRPRRTGGRDGGDGGPRSSSLDSLVSGAVANSSPDDAGKELDDDTGEGGGRALCAAICFLLLKRVIIIVNFVDFVTFSCHSALLVKRLSKNIAGLV